MTLDNGQGMIYNFHKIDKINETIFHPSPSVRTHTCRSLSSHPSRKSLFSSGFRPLKELYLTGSNATVPSAWPKAITLLASGALQTEPLVSEVVPLSDWEWAFTQLRQKDALKILLQPE